MSSCSAAAAELLTAPGSFKHRASSVLNRAGEFASRHMFDGTEETCWNSDQGSPQFITFDFEPSRVVLSQVKMMFQGGFVGQDAVIEVCDQQADAGGSGASMLSIGTLEHIEDCNRLQSFDLAPDAQQPSGARFVRITFPQSTDFYGRVTLYRLELWGSRK
jgi:hypothetical protein